MNRDLRRLWASAGVSAFGTALSEVALPIVALFGLHATSLELGALVSVDQVAWLAFGLPAGVWVDRWSRRRVVVAADLGRAALMAVLPVLAWTGALSVGALLVVMALFGVFNVLGGVAYGALTPEVVEASGLVDANARINVTDTAAGLSGSAAVGPVVAWLGAPVALALDAVSFLGSALLMSGVRSTPAPRTAPRSAFRAELVEGVRLVFGHRLLRTLMLGSAAFNACAAAQYVLAFVFLRSLHTPTAGYGALLASGGVGALVGSALLPAMTRRWGEARVWRTFLVAGPAIGVLIPLARPGVWLWLFAVGSFGLAASVAITSIIGFSARQAMCPAPLLGRVAATTRVVTWGVVPVGAMAGGWLGSVLDARTALWVIAAAYFAEPVILRCSRAWSWPGIADEVSGVRAPS